MAKVIAKVERNDSKITLQQIGTKIKHQLEIGEGLGIDGGIIMLRNTKKIGLHLHFDNLPGCGSRYTLPLRTDGAYNLTAEYGYRVKSPDEEKDPLKRILREEKVSTHGFRCVSASKEVLFQGNLRNHFTAYEEVLTDGFQNLLDRRSEQPVPENMKWVKIHDGSFVIVLLKEDHSESARTIKQKILKVVVREDCDPEYLRRAVQEVMSHFPIRHFHAESIGARLYTD